MKVAVIAPEDQAIRLVDAPDDSDQRWTWIHETINGDLDFNTLGAWSTPDVIVQMIVDDWFLSKGLALNPVATQLYMSGYPASLAATSPGIRGTVVLEAADITGEQIPLPRSVIDRWIVNRFRVEGL